MDKTLGHYHKWIKDQKSIKPRDYPCVFKLDGRGRVPRVIQVMACSIGGWREYIDPRYKHLSRALILKWPMCLPFKDWPRDQQMQYKCVAMSMTYYSFDVMQSSPRNKADDNI